MLLNFLGLGMLGDQPLNMMGRSFVRFLLHRMFRIHVKLDQLSLFQIVLMSVLDFCIRFVVDILFIEVLIVITVKDLKFIVVLKGMILITFEFR